MLNRALKTTMLSLAIAGALGSAGTSRAEETVAVDDAASAAKAAADNDGQVLEEVVVTATRRSTELLETPIAVTAITQDALTRRDVKDVRDLGDAVPNLHFGLSPDDSGVLIAIRGVTSTNFTEIGDPAVGIHIDGLYSPRPQGALALMFDLDQVEVLRGPQGTLFGRNSTGGSINIIPAKPDLDGTYGEGQVQLGNYNAKQVRASGNFVLGERFALRAAVMNDERDGFIRQRQDFTDRDIPERGFHADGIPDVDQRFNTKVDRSDYYNNVDEWAVRLSGLWQVTDSVDWLLSYEKFQNDGAGEIQLKDCRQARGTIHQCTGNQYDAQINVPGIIDMSIDTYRSLLSVDVNDTTTFEYRFAYADQRRFQQHDDDYGYHPLDSQVSVTLPVPAEGDWGVWHVDDRASWTLDSKYVSTVHEAQLKQSFDEIRYVGGLFWMHEKNAIDFAQDLLVNAPYGYPLGPYYHQPDRQIDAKAVFAQADWEFAPTWTFTFGGRYSWDEKTDRRGETWGRWDADDPWYYNGHFDPGIPGEPGHRHHNGLDLTRDMGPFAGSSAYPGPVYNDHSEAWEKFTWRLGLMHMATPNDMFYGSASTGYKAGGFGDQTDLCGGRDCVDGPAGPHYSFLPYKPETVTNFEFGYKGKKLDGRLNLAATLFYSRYQDMQVTETHTVGQQQLDEPCPEDNPFCDIVETWSTENVAKSDIYGLELEVDTIPWENGRLTAFFAWLHTEIKSYPTFNDQLFCDIRELYDAPACPEQYNGPDPALRGRQIYDVRGNQLPFSPEFALTLNYSHHFRFDSGYVLEPWVSVHWQDKMYFTPRNLDNPHISDSQPAYTTVDATLRLQSPQDRWYLEAYVNNATDQKVKNWFSQGNGFVLGGYNPPRMYGLRFGVRL